MNHFFNQLVYWLCFVMMAVIFVSAAIGVF